MSDNSNDFMAKMPQGTGLKLPPPIFKLLEGEVIETTDTTLTMRFPVKEIYQNPFGYMQGGMLAAIMDNTIGPLSFMVAAPNVTTQFNTTYLRPVTPEDKELTVVAELTERTRKLVFFKVTVRNAAGKTICFAHASHRVIGD